MADFPTEGFTDAQNPIAGNWTSGPGGFGDILTTGGTARATADQTDCAAIYTAGTFSNDQYSQIVWTVKALDAISLIVRCNTSGDCYLVNIGATSIAAYKVTGGTSFQGGLGDNVNATIAQGSVIKLTVSGTDPTTLTLYDDTEQIGTWADDGGTPFLSGYAGFHIYDNSATNQVDDWIGGPSTAAGRNPVAMGFVVE